MSSPQAPYIIQTGSGGPSIMKILLIGVAVIIGVLVVTNILNYFFKAMKGPFKVVEEVADKATAQLSWAENHWYLFMTAFVLSLIVPTANKALAKYIADVDKTNVSESEKMAMTEKIIEIDASQRASEAVDPAERERWKNIEDGARGEFEKRPAEERESAEKRAREIMERRAKK